MSEIGRSEDRGISFEEIRLRRSRAREHAEQAGYRALLVIGRSFYDRPGDLAYLTNHFPPFPTAVFSEGNAGLGHGFLLLPVDGDPVLLTDPRRHRADLVDITDVRAASDLGLAVIDLLRERSLDSGRIGLIADDILPAALDRRFRSELPRLQLEPEPSIVSSLRRIKSRSELSLLRHAARCAHAGLTAAHTRFLDDGVTERDVSATGTASAIAAGADFVRYFRVHSGPWAAAGSRWPPAMDRVITPDDVVVVDVIGAHQGYQFDVNRTFGRPILNGDARTIAETVEAATASAVDACRAGNTVDDIYQAATRVIGRSPFAELMGPMIGHGIGLETVELPYIRAGDETVLEPGMVLCVEPGIFIAGRGGAAIEQEVIINADGPPEVITPTPTRMW